MFLTGKPCSLQKHIQDLSYFDESEKYATCPYQLG
jgi:hypothetical protein